MQPLIVGDGGGRLWRHPAAQKQCASNHSKDRGFGRSSHSLESQPHATGQKGPLTVGRGKDFRERRRRGFDDDDYSHPRDRGSGAAIGGFSPPHSFAPAGSPVGATVKWFNPEKGFGFVVVDGAGDAFLHAAVLERSGHGAVQPGATLQVRTDQGQKGLQVSEVLEVDASTVTRDVGQESRQAERRSANPQMALGHTVSIEGTVKWFSADKGFGFVAADSGGKDVFVHASALQRSGLMRLAEGQRVIMDVRQGQKGPEVATLRLAD
jgi:cold shock protein